MPGLARTKIFLTVDLTAGYWHCVLDHESSLLTTFATPFSRYRGRRLPFGLSAFSQIFQKWVSQPTESLTLENLHLADTPSRAYLSTTTHPTGAEFEHINTTAFLPEPTLRLQEIQQATESDEALRILKNVILHGCPEHRDQRPSHITTPNQQLMAWHEAKAACVTPGAQSCLRQAQETIFWPGMNAEVKEIITSCENCRKYQTNINQKESLMPHDVPSQPWEQIRVDLFKLNKKEFMVTVDYCSNFWEDNCLTSTTSVAIILKLKNFFAQCGCADCLISHNGPQFTSSEFTKFAKEWDFEHRTNNPDNSKANGKVESAVKTAKNLIRKALDSRTNPYIAILNYSNTANQGMERRVKPC